MSTCFNCEKLTNYICFNHGEAVCMTCLVDTTNHSTCFVNTLKKFDQEGANRKSTECVICGQGLRSEDDTIRLTCFHVCHAACILKQPPAKEKCPSCWTTTVFPVRGNQTPIARYIRTRFKEANWTPPNSFQNENTFEPTSSSSSISEPKSPKPLPLAAQVIDVESISPSAESNTILNQPNSARQTTSVVPEKTFPFFTATHPRTIHSVQSVITNRSTTMASNDNRNIKPVVFSVHANRDLEAGQDYEMSDSHGKYAPRKSSKTTKIFVSVLILALVALVLVVGINRRRTTRAAIEGLRSSLDKHHMVKTLDHLRYKTFDKGGGVEYHVIDRPPADHPPPDSIRTMTQ